MTNRCRVKTIFTSGHFELFLFKVSGVIYHICPKPFVLGLSKYKKGKTRKPNRAEGVRKGITAVIDKKMPGDEQ